MKYFQIDRSAEPKVIGVTNAGSQVEITEAKVEKSQEYSDFKNYFDDYNKEFWQKQDKVASLNPPLLHGRMRSKAKFTDIMKCNQAYSFLYFVYSGKYIDILKAFNLPNNKTFELEIENCATKYYLMFTETVRLEEIDFDKSTVVTGFKALNNIKYHTVKNTKEYIDFKEKEPISTFELLVVPQKYYGTDIITVQGAGKPFYSERLVDFLLDCGITGLEVAYNNSIQLEFV